MKCVNCGKAKMIHDTRDISYVYKGQRTVIPQVSGEYCPACDESIHNAEESEYLNNAMREFNKEVNAATVNPAFISETRKKLNLDQREAGELFGGGSNAFSRYENGKTKPALALVQLFKLLDKHPELLKELRTAPPATAATKSNTRTRRRKTLYA